MSYPLDLVTGAAAAYSVSRKLRAAYAGSALRVRRSSDNTELDIGFVGDELDTATLMTFVGVNNGFVVTLYDQSGNARHATQATTARQPKIIVTGAMHELAGHRPTIAFNPAPTYLAATGFTLAQPNTVFAVGLIGNIDGTLYDSAVTTKQTLRKTGGQWALTAGTALFAPLDDTDFHTFTALFKNTTSVLRIDGTEKAAGNTGTNSMTGFHMGALAGGGTSGDLDGKISEVIIYNSDKTANFATIENDLIDYYMGGGAPLTVTQPGAAIMTPTTWNLPTIYWPQPWKFDVALPAVAAGKQYVWTCSTDHDDPQRTAIGYSNNLDGSDFVLWGDVPGSTGEAPCLVYNPVDAEGKVWWLYEHNGVDQSRLLRSADLVNWTVYGTLNIGDWGYLVVLDNTPGSWKGHTVSENTHPSVISVVTSPDGLNWTIGAEVDGRSMMPLGRRFNHLGGGFFNINGELYVLGSDRPDGTSGSTGGDGYPALMRATDTETFLPPRWRLLDWENIAGSSDDLRGVTSYVEPDGTLHMYTQYSGNVYYSVGVVDAPPSTGTANVHVGSTVVAVVYRGGSVVSRIYKGSTIVFGSEP